MIKRYVPGIPDGIKTRFSLPSDYVKGTNITLFANGQLVDVMDDNTHPYGYYIDVDSFVFYSAPLSIDTLYVMYEVKDLAANFFNNINWSKNIIKIDFYPKPISKTWSTKVIQKLWPLNIKQKNWSTKVIQKKFDRKVVKINFKYKTCVYNYKY